MYCTFWIAKCLCKVSTSDIHSSFFRWHLKHDLTHGSKDQKGSHEEGEKEDICVSQRMEFANNFDHASKKGYYPSSSQKNTNTPLVFIPQWASSSIPTKAEKWRKTGWSFLLGNDDSWTTQLTLLVPFSSPLRKKPNSHNFRNMSKSGVISLIDWKIKKVGLDLVDYFFKDHPIEIDINPTESFFSNENIP